MSDDLPSLRGRIGKKLNILAKITPIIVVGLFFLFHFSINNISLAEAPEAKVTLEKYKPIDFGEFDPLEPIKKRLEIIEIEKRKNKQKEKEIRKDAEVKNGKYYDLVVSHPIEEMLPYISKCDSKTASFLIAIAKKESNWGKHAPQKANKDCYNYWGYRGTYNQTDSGYSCFDSPEQAIAVVGERIRDLIEKEIDTPEEMIIWKCGSSCAGHDPAGVRKWISDVAMYYEKLNS